MRQTIHLLALLFLTGLTLNAQKVVVKGSLFDGATKEPLVMGFVQIGELGVSTDNEGRFVLALDPGTYDVIASITGYEDLVTTVAIAAADNPPLEFALTPSENLLDATTVTASRFEKKLGEQIVSMDILRPRLIENYAAPTIERVLDKLPGVDILDGQANIRGGSGFSYGAGSRVMLLIDDLPALQGDLGLPQWGDVPIEMIERVEVVKGSASSLYGSAALNGVINIRTLQPGSEPVTKAATFLTGFWAPRDQYRDNGIGQIDTFSNKWWDDFSPFQTGVQFMHAQKFGRFGVVLGGNFQNMRGYIKDTYSYRNRISAKFSYLLSENISLGVNAFVNKGAQQDYFYWKNSYGGQFQGSDLESSQITGTNLRYAIDPYVTMFDPVGNKHKLFGRIYRVENTNTNNQSNSHTLYYAEYQFTTKFDNLGLAATAGLVGQHVNAKGQVYDNKQFKTYNFAPYLQLDWKVLGRLTFGFGIRHELNHILSPDTVKSWSGGTFGSIQNVANPNPRITEGRLVMRAGLNYEVTKGTYLRASWGQGYRAPTIGEKFIYTAAAFPIIPNLQLNSEQGWTAEIGIKQGIKLGDWNGYLDMSGFLMDFDDMTEFLFGGTDPLENPITAIQSVNVGDTRIWGFEFGMLGQGKIGNVQLNSMLGYTYIDPKYKNFGPLEDQTSTVDYNILKYRFKHNFKTDIEAVYGRFATGLTALFRSRIEAVDPLFTGVVANLGPYLDELNGNWVFDVRLSYQITSSVKVSGLIKNMLNELYQLRPAKAEAPRNWTLRLDASF